MADSFRILVGDHQPVMQAYYRETLPLLGHEIVGIVGTGREFIEQCKALQPDLVITDCELPEMSAREAVRQINQEKPLPVVCLCHYEEPDRTEAKIVLEHLVKPVGAVELGDAIARAMQRFQQLEADDSSSVVDSITS